MMFDGTFIRELEFTVRKPEGTDPDPIIVAHPDQAKVYTGIKHLVSVTLKPGWKIEGKHREGALRSEGFFGMGRSGL